MLVWFCTNYWEDNKIVILEIWRLKIYIFSDSWVKIMNAWWTTKLKNAPALLLSLCSSIFFRVELWFCLRLDLFITWKKSLNLIVVNFRDSSLPWVSTESWLPRLELLAPVTLVGLQVVSFSFISLWQVCLAESQVSRLVYLLSTFFCNLLWSWEDQVHGHRVPCLCRAAVGLTVSLGKNVFAELLPSL